MRYREWNESLIAPLFCREPDDEEDYDNDDPIDDASLDDWADVIVKQHERRADEPRRMIASAKRCPSYQIRRTSRLVTRFFDWTLREADAGLRSTQLAVLCAIQNAPARECMQDVARRLWMHPSTLSRAADALEERGLVERLEAPWDGRVVRLRITDAGRELLRAACAAWRDAQARLLMKLSIERLLTAIAGSRDAADGARRCLHDCGLRAEMHAQPGVDPAYI